MKRIYLTTIKEKKEMNRVCNTNRILVKCIIFPLLKTPAPFDFYQ